MHSVNFTHFNVLFSWHTFVYHSCTAYLAYIGMIFRVYIFFVRSTRHVSSKDVRLLPRKQTQYPARGLPKRKLIFQPQCFRC